MPVRRQIEDSRTVMAESTTRPRLRRDWLPILITGFCLWVAAIAATLVTGNPNLVPSLVLLGSFLVPVTFVAWLFERWRDEYVTTELVVKAFVVGGLLGVLGAAVLEAYLLRPSWLLFLGVGLIEEGVKLAALVLVTRRMTRRTGRDGILLGAAIGFGFAAFETAGYALNAMLTVRGLSLTALVQTELLRSVLAPLGHGLWTAILGGVLFRASRGGRFRFTPAVVLTYLWVSVLHALWDSTHNIAVVLTYLLTGTQWQLHLLTLGYIPSPTPDQVRLFSVLSIAGLAVVSVLGLITLWRCWRSVSGETESVGRHAQRDVDPVSADGIA
jgi:RsiW-degrading membrane proteinase PrsW (M82 family)